MFQVHPERQRACSPQESSRTGPHMSVARAALQACPALAKVFDAAWDRKLATTKFADGRSLR